MTHADPVTTLKDKDPVYTDGKSNEGHSAPKKPWDGQLSEDEIEAEAVLQAKYSGKPVADDKHQSAEVRK